jgi:hypothetical protein
MIHKAADTVDLHLDVFTTQAEASDLKSLTTRQIAACRTNPVDPWVNAHSPAVITREVAVSGRLAYEWFACLRERNVRLLAL